MAFGVQVGSPNTADTLPLAFEIILDQRAETTVLIPEVWVFRIRIAAACRGWQKGIPIRIMNHAVLLASVRENPVKFTSKMRPADILRPLRDPAYRPLLFYCIIGGLTGGFASPFLSVYELRVLGLSHTFITSVGVVSAVVGMAGSWVWGRLADHTAWNCVIWLTAFLNLSCTLGWSFVRPSFAHLVAPVLIVVAAGCAGGASLASTNLQFALSPESGKTAYFGVTAAMSSIATCTSAAVGTAIQPMLEKSMGDSSISLLFFVAGIGGFANLIINGRKLPSVT